MQRLINGLPPWEYIERDAHKVKLVDFNPVTTEWNKPIGEANKTSHKVIVDAGMRVNKAGHTFHAWHSPNVVTERIPIGSFVEFGIELYESRKIKTIKTAGASVKSNASDRSSKVGEWDDPEASPDDDLGTVAASESRTGHAAYLRDKRRRERGLDAVYANYVLGIAPVHIVLDRARRHVKEMGNRSLKLAALRNDALKDVADYLQEFLMEVLPKIEAKAIEGPLSHWLNRGFKFHFIDAQNELTKEWNWNRFLAGLGGQGAQDSEWTERLQEAAPESLTEDDSPAPKPSMFAHNQAASVESNSVPATKREIPFWAQKTAVSEFLRLHPTGVIRQVYLSIFSEGLDGKQTAINLDITEPKVSRLRTKIQNEIYELGLILAGTKADD